MVTPPNDASELTGRMNAPVRILYVSHTPDFRGSAMSLSQLMTGLDRDEFIPVAAFSKDGPLVRELRSRNISTHVLKKRGFLGTGLIREALNLIGMERINLVHLNSAVPFSKYVGIAARLKRLPVIWHVREDPNGKRVRRLKKWIDLLSNRIIVVSTQLEAAFGRKMGKLVRVYNGVDTDRFSVGVDGAPFRKKFGLPREAFVFGIVGTIEENKGTILFLKAAEVICASESAGSVFFAVIGDGQPEDVDRVHGFLYKRPALAERTVLTGRLGNMPEVMAGIDVLVMASLGENFPRVLIEAMASGKPVVATDVGEVFHIVDDGVTGLVVPKNDAGALASAMTRCLEMRDSLREMGSKAREKVVREFDLRRHVESVQNEYRELFTLHGSI
ncbi:MAG: glycosyltransferase, partial [Deltaproteobacteria bacterium]